MSYLLLKEKLDGQFVPARVFSNPRLAQIVLQPMRWRILTELVDGEKCAKDLAKMLQTSEQVVCYHLRELERSDFIHVEKTVKVRGATAKYYRAEQKAVAVVPGADMIPDGPQHAVHQPLSDPASKLLDPFVSRGRFNGLIVVGNPEIHGIYRAGARDGDRATDLAMFIGSMLPLSRDSVVRLDTEMSQEELQQNLILVGGPRVNTVTLTVNDWLPITHQLTGHGMMTSKLSGRNYLEDYEGAVQMILNPTNQDARVIVIAGNNFLGTRAGILAFIRHTDDLAAGNVMNRAIVAKVVSGLDNNSDGLLDEVQFLE